MVTSAEGNTHQYRRRRARATTRRGSTSTERPSETAHARVWRTRQSSLQVQQCSGMLPAQCMRTLLHPRIHTLYFNTIRSYAYHPYYHTHSTPKIYSWHIDPRTYQCADTRISRTRARIPLSQHDCLLLTAGDSTLRFRQ